MGKGEGCFECIRKNPLAQHKHKTSPPVTSFFKVMIGDQFSKILFLPPLFAPTVSSLIDQSTFLEDSNGQQWKVKVSYVDGSLAFQQGWSSFSVDHGLEVGDFLVFNYIIGEHFVVKIYTKSGCEKLEFCEKSKTKKRGRACSSFTARHGLCRSIDTDSMDRQGSNVSTVSGSGVEIGQNQCKTTNNKHTKIATENDSRKPLSKVEFTEPPYYMVNRDLGKGEDRSTIFDLSCFEMWKNKAETDGSNKIITQEERFPLHIDMSLRSMVEVGSSNVDLVDKQVATGVQNSEASKFKMMEKNSNTEQTERTVIPFDRSKIEGRLLTTSDVIPGKKGDNSYVMSSTEIVRYQIAEGILEDSVALLSEYDRVKVPLMEHAAFREISHIAQLEINRKLKSLEIQNCESAVKALIVKQKPVEIEFCSDRKMIQRMHGEHNFIIKDIPKIEAPVKIEPADSFQLSRLDVANVYSSIAMGNQSFLEFPMGLPLWGHKGRSNIERRKVVLLYDSEMRMWPVLCHEMAGFRILTSGWEALSKANDIHPGDECVFQIRNLSERIFSIRVVRKQD